MGVGATPTVREGGEERGIAQWGRRWEVDNCVFPFTSRGELAGGWVRPVVPAEGYHLSNGVFPLLSTQDLHLSRNISTGK